MEGGTYVFARPKRSDPQQLERTAPPEQYEGGAELAKRNLCILQFALLIVVGNKVTKTVSGEATVENK